MTQTQNRLLIAAGILFAIVTGYLTLQQLQPPAPENSKHKTRILTWWGYFGSASKRKEIEALCDTELEIWEYQYTEGMQNLAESYTYDLYVYPWGYDRYIRPYFKQEGPKINWMVDNYHQAIRHKYQEYQMPEDTVLFQLATHMFVYDKHYIPNLESLTADDIMALTRSNDGKVMMMDSLTEMDWFIKQLKLGTPEDNWQALYQQFRARRHWDKINKSGLRFHYFIPDYLDSQLILGNLYSGELMNPHYYLRWSELKDTSGKSKDWGFGAHPKLSNVSFDVLALKSEDSRHQCVAHTLGSRSFLKWVAETSWYFSPFEETDLNLPEQLQRLTQEFYDIADKLPWPYDLHNESPPSPEAQKIWKTMIACQYEDQYCDRRAALTDKILAGRS